VAPAAHYLIGGVSTDLEGRTSIAGLSAAGGCAATGVHGANRMAGNSLTEAVVFGRRAAAAMTEEAAAGFNAADATADAPPMSGDDHGWRTLRRAMSEGAGLVRDAESLRGAIVVLDKVLDSPDESLRLAATTARLICEAALQREESRGVHFRSDHPVADPAWDSRHIELRTSAPAS